MPKFSMLKKSPFFILSFLIIIVLFGSLLFVPNVKATSSYQWLQNAGFDDGGYNLVHNSGFESTYFTNGTDGWNYGGVFVANGHSGSYSMQFRGIYYDQISQLFNSISVNSITTFSCWIFANQYDDHAIRLRIGYNDSTFNDVIITTTTSWTYHNFTSNLVAGKYIVSIWFSNDGCNYYTYSNVDDVYLGITGIGQTTITSISSPWYAGSSTGFRGINLIEGYYGASAYFGYGDVTSNKIIQDINYLDTNKIINCNLMIRTGNSSNTVFWIDFVYSDRISNSINSSSITSSQGWVYWNLTGLILQNKVLIQIQIGVISGAEDCYCYIDSVDLIASVPSNFHRFSWILSPPVINSTFISFYANRQASIMYCNIYDNDNNLTESGGYQVISDSTGTITGLIVNGAFSFSIVPIQYSFNSSELIKITIFTGDTTLTFSITAYWIYIESGVILPISLTIPDWLTFNNIIVIVIFGVVCCLCTWAFKFTGLIAGIGISTLITGILGLLPIWGVGLCIVLDITLIVLGSGLLNKGTNNEGHN